MASSRLPSILLQSPARLSWALGWIPAGASAFPLRTSSRLHLRSAGLQEIAPQLKDRVRVVKIDTDKYPGIAARNKIEGLPTLILYEGGVPIDRMEGYLPADQLLKRVQSKCSPAM